MSTVAPTPPAAPRPSPSAAVVDSEGYIDDHIRRTRRALKLVDLSAGLLSLAVAVLGYLLVAALLDQWVFAGGLGTAGRIALFGVLLAFVAWHAVRHFLPLLRPINPVYAAHTIEKNAPSLKNSLLNVLLFRTHRQQMSAKVYHALEQQAAQRLSVSAGEAAIDHTALLRLGYALLAIVAVCALYSVLSPKNLAVSAARILAPWSDLAAPTRVKILEVQPGDTAVARGERLTVSAEIRGARADEPVRLRYSTADEQAVDETIVMTRPAAGLRYEAQLPRPADAGGAVGVMQELVYWIEAGDAHTRHYPVAVFDRPTLVVERVRYEFPAYTGIPSTEVAGTGDLRGVEGTRVTLRAIASQPIKTASIDFDADGTSDLAMSVEGEKSDRAVGSFVLALRDDRRTPAHPNYALRLETAAGRKNADPAQYRIEITPDYAPEVQITKPEEPETAVRVDEIVLIGVEARDPDFALAQLRLVGKAGDRDVLIGDLMPDNKHRDGRVGAIKPFTPADALLKPGDVLEYWAEARDNRRPEPNVAVSPHRRLKIIGGTNDHKPATGGREANQPPNQPDQQQPGDGSPQGGQQGGGQQQGGDPQQGEQGGEGQPGQQGVAGGQGEGQPNDKPQDGQSAPGGAGESGDNPEQNSAAGGQGAGQPKAAQDPAAKPNDQDNAAGGEGQPDQKAATGSREANKGHDQPNDASPSAQSKVSSEGEADGDAFQRIEEHFARQDANNQQQPGAEQDPNNKAATGGRESNPAANQPDKSQQPGDQPQDAGDGQQQPKQQSGSPNPSAKSNPQQKPGAGQSGEPQPSGDGKAQAQAGAQDPNQRRAPDKAQQGKPGDGNPGEQSGGEKPAPNSAPNANQGNAGSGRASDEDQGAANLDNAPKQAREKSDADNRRAEGDKEPSSGSPDQRESDSRGSTGGDASGGGQEGGGQHADAPGKSDAGQNEAADQGAGKAAEKGDGETGDQAGDQQLADGKTGQSSGDKPGQGSKSRESEGADPNHKAATGDREADPSANQPQAGKPGDQPPNKSDQQAGDQPGEQPGDQSAGDSGKQAADQSGDQPGDQAGQQADEESGKQSGKPSNDSGQQAGKQSDKQEGAKSEAGSKSSAGDSAASNPQGGAAASQSQGGGTNSGAPAPEAQPPTAEEIADKANLDYARQQTDLMLERLDDQLAKKKVDPKLLHSLGWNEDELRRFVQRWEGLKARADDNDPDALHQLDAALRSLGLRRSGPLRFRADATADKVRDLNEAYRTRAPLEYSERVRAYVKGAAGGEGEK